MDNDLLKQAIECLVIQDVFLSGSGSFVSADVDPKFDEAFKKLPVSFLHEVTESQIIELDTDEGESVRFFRVFVNVGARWRREKDADDSIKNAAAQIEATFIAEYLMTNEVNEDALSEFALNNVSYHVWPYWREYLMSQCTRMNLPKMPLPIKQFASNRDVNAKDK